jgi:hypothetical protein
MTDFLNALKADLLDRRLLPIVALVAVALVGTLAYAALGGGSSSAPVAAVAPSAPVTVAAGGIATSEASAATATAEVTSGASDQRRGLVHNPFTALKDPAAEAAAAKTAASASGSSTTGVSGGSAAAPSTTSPEPATPAKPSKPAKRHTIYHVAVLFGALPAAGASEPLQLTPFEHLKLLTPLPSSTLPLIVFRGVTTGGKSATFTVVGEAILHGSATCLPSSSQCQAIDLKPGQTEQLEYLPATGPVVIYELRIVSIASSKASTAGVRSFLRGVSKAGRVVLARKGLRAIPFLRHTSQAGVLAFAERRSGVRAHIARHKHHRR